MPVERSGHTTRKSNTKFAIPDDADNAEGIAGQAWARNQVVVVSDLPEIKEGTSQKDIKDYSNKTWVTDEWVKRNRPQSRTYCGMPVEVKGKLWGVLVFDSRAINAIDGEAASQEYSIFAGLIGELLERA